LAELGPRQQIEMVRDGVEDGLQMPLITAIFSPKRWFLETQQERLLMVRRSMELEEIESKVVEFRDARD
jgi:hypothetical protein